MHKRLNQFGDDPKKAFGPQQPKLLKPSKDGRNAPEVRAVRIEITQNAGLLVRGGVADLGEMVCVDVFHQEGGFTVVPQYQASPAKMRGAVPNSVDGAYCFSLTKNDLVEVTLGKETVRGYFVMYESDGRMTLRGHDQPQPDKSYFRESVSKATRITKFHVDVLGNIYPTKPEPSRGLA